MPVFFSLPLFSFVGLAIATFFFFSFFLSFYSWFFLVLQCQGCERHGEISLIPGHGTPLSQNHCTEVDLMLFHCDGLLPVEYSFNGGWLATTVHFYQHNFDHFYLF